MNNGKLKLAQAMVRWNKGGGCAAMRERPILFSAPMVRAILEGRKTQTRRVCTHPLFQTMSHVVDCGDGWWGDEEGAALVRCPYGQPGDRLWVRETFCHLTEFEGLPAETYYKADGGDDDDRRLPPSLSEYRWKPSIHMPRNLSRILLEVVSVRVERLQDISSMDAVAEGVNVHPDHHSKPRSSIYSPVQAYRNLWESINGDESWEENPWVWAIEFRRIAA